MRHIRTRSRDLLVCHKQALFAQRSYELLLNLQIGMVYGLLDIKNCGRVSRAEAMPFGEFLLKARDVEANLSEAMKNSRNKMRKKNKCSFFGNTGHSTIEYRTHLANQQASKNKRILKSPVVLEKSTFSYYDSGVNKSKCSITKDKAVYIFCNKTQRRK